MECRTRERKRKDERKKKAVFGKGKRMRKERKI
jgi:hypothetical protein